MRMSSCFRKTSLRAVYVKFHKTTDPKSIGMNYEIVMDYIAVSFPSFCLRKGSKFEDPGTPPVTLGRSITQVRSTVVLSSTELSVVDRQTDV